MYIMGNKHVKTKDNDGIINTTYIAHPVSVIKPFFNNQKPTEAITMLINLIRSSNFAKVISTTLLIYYYLGRVRDLPF